MSLGQDKQQNICVNRARHLVFFEGSDLCYNYKTGQWSTVPAYNGIGMYSVNSETADIGLVRFSSGSVDLQTQTTSHDPQTAVITTGSPNINPGGRAVVHGVRPIANGGTYSVRVGTLDDIDGTVSWSAATSVNTRSNMASFRAEGRYHRIELTVTGGFTTLLGADIDFTAQGKV